MNARSLIACLWLFAASSVTAQVFLTNYPVADTFVRSLDPTHNYGGAGAVSVSGAIAPHVIGPPHGLLDSFLRFYVFRGARNFHRTFCLGSLGVGAETM